MIDAFNIYDNMDRNNILLSFKGDITSELLTSILQIMENKMDDMQEENLYHHMDDATDFNGDKNRSAIFMIAKNEGSYNIITGNYILNENIHGLKSRLDDVNALSKEQLKDYYKSVLNNGEMSLKGGGGLGMIDIARKTGE